MLGHAPSAWLNLNRKISYFVIQPVDRKYILCIRKEFTMALENQKIVVLICADEEWRIVRDRLCPVEINSSPFGEWFPHNFDIQERRVMVAFFQTGCGKIPAAAATQFVIDKCSPKIIINLGTCGGFKGKVKKNNVLMVKETVVCDICERSGQNDEMIEKYRTFLDLPWLERPFPMNAVPVTIATADQDLDPKTIPFLIEKHRAVAADWESGAIAHVAKKKNGMECLIVRGVSDVVDPNGKPSNEKEIMEGTGVVMEKLIDGLPKWISKASFIVFKL